MTRKFTATVQQPQYETKDCGQRDEFSSGTYVMGDIAARGYMHARYAPTYRGVKVPLDLRADGVPRSAFEAWKRGVDADRDTPKPKPDRDVRNVYLDTEFLRGDLSPSGLVPVALTDDQGRDYYAVNADMDYDNRTVHRFLTRGGAS